MTPEQELQQLRQDNAELLNEKAQAVKAWHDEIRATLKRLSEEIASIQQNITRTLILQDWIKKLDARVEALEKFQIKAMGIAVGAVFALGVVWKVIDKLWS